MTLITFKDGQAVMRDGKVGTEQGCCCGCPPGCPSLEGCTLTIVLDYPGTPIEYYSGPADQPSAACTLLGTIADIPIEQGGDIEWELTIGYDANCNGSITGVTLTRTVDSPDNAQSCDDGVTNCVPVVFTLDCNPLP